MRNTILSILLIFALSACGDDPVVNPSDTVSSADTAATDTMSPADTTVADTAVADTQTADTAVADTAVADTQAADITPKPDPVMGLSTQTLVHDNVTREYLLYVPASYDGSVAFPLVMNFHGFSGYAQGHMQQADMRPLADSENFILIYPQGTELDGEPHWNTYPLDAGGKSSTDDIGFIHALLDVMLQDYAIDSSRVYATGYSNGGDFCYTLACYMNDRVTGIAPVSGLMWEQTFTDCVTSHPTAVMSLHGTDDFVRPYEGYEGYMVSIPATLAYWAGQNNIAGAPTITTLNAGGVQLERHDYPAGDGGVTMRHYKVIGGGHIWFDFTEDGVQSNALIWNFLSQFNQAGGN